MLRCDRLEPANPSTTGEERMTDTPHGTEPSAGTVREPGSSQPAVQGSGASSGHAALWALLQRISMAVPSAPSLDAGLRTVCLELATALGLPWAAVYLLDPESGTARLAAAYPESAGSSEAGGLLLGASSRLRRRLAETQQPLTLTGTHTDPLAADLLDALGQPVVDSILLAPVVVQDDLVGVLSLAWAGRPQRSTAGEIQTVQAIARQVGLLVHTDRLAQQLAAEEQAEAEFVDFVAHELKQPMTAMQGYAKMLTLGIGGELNDRQKEFVEVIDANVGRMGKLVGDLLEVSRLEAGRIHLDLAPVQVPVVLGEVVSSAREEIERRHHTLDQTFPDDLPPVWADQERLVQILTHLLRNAYMYTPEGGRISVAAGVLDSAGQAGPRIQIRVRDTGIGLSPADQAHLGERFFRADHDLVRGQAGTGLGLSIVRGLVELHGGALRVESQPGTGSVFSVTLPIAADPPA